MPALERHAAGKGAEVPRLTSQLKLGKPHG
jgi:hypothetical protein